MAFQHIHRPPFITAIGSFFSSLFNAMIDARAMRAAAEARAVKIQMLNAKTDAELARMNLRRSEIPAFVFRDLMYS